MHPQQPPPGWSPPPRQFAPRLQQERPSGGTAIAAAVLGFLFGALSLTTIFGAGLTPAILGVLLAALYITGGILLLVRRTAGRVLLVIGAVLGSALGTALFVLSFVLETVPRDPLRRPSIYFGLMLVVLGVTLLVLSLTKRTTHYLHAKQRGLPVQPWPQRQPPYWR